MVPKSRTLKGSRPLLKPFKVHYDTFFFLVSTLSLRNYKRLFKYDCIEISDSLRIRQQAVLILIYN